MIVRDQILELLNSNKQAYGDFFTRDDRSPHSVLVDVEHPESRLATLRCLKPEIVSWEFWLMLPDLIVVRVSLTAAGKDMLAAAYNAGEGS